MYTVIQYSSLYNILDIIYYSCIRDNDNDNDNDDDSVNDTHGLGITGKYLVKGSKCVYIYIYNIYIYIYEYIYI